MKAVLVPILLLVFQLSVMADYTFPLPDELNGRALLCADQADFHIKLLVPDGKGAGEVVWSYPEGAEKFQYMPTDAKRVEIEGVTYVLAAYHGRVQMVRYEDRGVIRDFSSHQGCHSAEILPDGVIVTASSNQGKLRLHFSEEDFADYDLPYAHGVCWDAKRECLWALGDDLRRYRYEERALKLEASFPLPLSPTGHDLFPMASAEKLLVSDERALYAFDVGKGDFETLSRLRHIKSVSEAVDGEIWITEPKKIEGAAEWQTDAVVALGEEGVGRYVMEGARFYKARWWQRVGFSYPVGE